MSARLLPAPLRPQLLNGYAVVGICLRTDRWQVEACRVRRASSTFFEDLERFPPGTAVFDCGFLMRDLPAH